MYQAKLGYFRKIEKVVTMVKYKFIDLSNYKILLKDNQYKSYYFKCLFIGPWVEIEYICLF